MIKKRPSWNDYSDRRLYDELLDKQHKTPEDVTDEELDFLHTMYHLEEFACGLDG